MQWIILGGDAWLKGSAWRPHECAGKRTILRKSAWGEEKGGGGREGGGGGEEEQQGMNVHAGVLHCMNYHLAWYVCSMLTYKHPALSP